jgi:hypothetical protein
MRRKSLFSCVLLFAACDPVDDDASAGDPTGDDAGKADFFGPSCPEAAAEAVLTCSQLGGNELGFVRHTGAYALDDEIVMTDLAGKRQLACVYRPAEGIDPAWASQYRRGEEEIEVSDAADLETLIEQTTDLNDEQRAEVVIEEPRLTVMYNIGFLNRLTFAFDGIRIGLEFFSRSASPDNLAASKTVFVIDRTAFDAGFGGTYRTGSSCTLDVVHP